MVIRVGCVAPLGCGPLTFGLEATVLLALVSMSLDSEGLAFIDNMPVAERAGRSQRRRKSVLETRPRHPWRGRFALQPALTVSDRVIGFCL